MKETIFEQWQLPFSATQKQLLELMEERAALAKLEGDFEEELYQETIQIIENPKLLLQHRFFTFQELDSQWVLNTCFVKAESELKQEVNQFSEMRPFLRKKFQALFIFLITNRISSWGDSCQEIF